MAKNQRIPRLGRHARSGQARMRLNGDDHYLGVWPADQGDPPGPVEAGYDRLILDSLTGGRRIEKGAPAVAEAARPSEGAEVGDALTVVELCVLHLKHCRVYYRHPGGEPTGAAENAAGALRPLIHLFGETAVPFGSKALRPVVDLMVGGYAHPEYGPQVPLIRPGVNARLGRIKAAFSWAVSQEPIPPAIREAVRSVRPLAPGRSDAPETKAVRPVPESVV